MAWKVPPQIRPDEPSNHAAARASMSLAARRVKVSSRIRLAGTPWLPCSHAARATSVLVFPVPAPASTSSGPPCCVAARRCCSLSPSSTALSSNMHLEHNQADRRRSVRRAGYVLSRLGPGIRRS